MGKYSKFEKALKDTKRKQQEEEEKQSIEQKRKQKEEQEEQEEEEKRKRRRQQQVTEEDDENLDKEDEEEDNKKDKDKEEDEEDEEEEDEEEDEEEEDEEEDEEDEDDEDDGDEDNSDDDSGDEDGSDGDSSDEDGGDGDNDVEKDKHNESESDSSQSSEDNDDLNDNDLGKDKKDKPENDFSQSSKDNHTERTDTPNNSQNVGEQTTQSPKGNTTTGSSTSGTPTSGGTSSGAAGGTSSGTAGGAAGGASGGAAGGAAGGASGGAAGGAAGGTAGGAAGGAAAGVGIGAVLFWVIVIIIIIILLVGIISFILNMPGAVVGKIGEVTSKAWTAVSTFIDGNKAAEVIVGKDDVVDAATYLEQMGYDLKGFGFLSEEVEDTLSAKKNTGAWDTFKEALKEDDEDETQSLPYTDFENSTAKERDDETEDEFVDVYLSEEHESSDDENYIKEDILMVKSADGEIEYVKSKFLAMYLAADNATYMVRNYSTDLLNRLLKITGSNNTSTGSGLIHFWNSDEVSVSKYIKNSGSLEFANVEQLLGARDMASVSRAQKILRVKNKNDGLFKTTYFNYSLDGWATSYGFPLELALSLHLSTLAPDFAKEVAERAAYDTTVDMALLETKENQVRERIRIDLDGDGQTEDYYIENKYDMKTHQKFEDGTEEEGYDTIEAAIKESYVLDDIDESIEDLYDTPEEAVAELENYLKERTNNGANKIDFGYFYFLEATDRIKENIHEVDWSNWDEAVSGECIDCNYKSYFINVKNTEELAKVISVLIGQGLAEYNEDEDGNNIGIVVDKDNENVSKIKDLFKTYFEIEEIGSNEDLFIAQKPEKNYATVEDIDEAEKNNNEYGANGWTIHTEKYRENDIYYITMYSADDNVCDTFYVPGEFYASTFGFGNLKVYCQATINNVWQWFFEGRELEVDKSFWQEIMEEIQKYFPVREYYRLVDLEGNPVIFDADGGYVPINGVNTYYVDESDGWFWRKAIPTKLVKTIKSSSTIVSDKEIYEVLVDAENAETENYTRFLPLITSVSNHWYQDLDFSGCYKWTEAEDGEYFEKVYQYVAESNDNSGVKKAASSGILYVEEKNVGKLEQIAEPKIVGDPGAWIMNKINNNKYYIYNGISKSENKQKINFTDIAVDAIAMLEQIQGEDSQQIIRMFKELVANYGITFEESQSTELKKKLFDNIIEGYSGTLLTEEEDCVYRCNIESVQSGFSEGLRILAPINGKIVYRSDDAVCIRIVAPGYEFDGYSVLISGFKIDEGIVYGQDITEGTALGITKKQDLKLTLRDANGMIVKNEYTMNSDT